MDFISHYHASPVAKFTSKTSSSSMCFVQLLSYNYYQQVGLAVDDIKSVQEKAALKKEALQVAITMKFKKKC